MTIYGVNNLPDLISAIYKGKREIMPTLKVSKDQLMIMAMTKAMTTVDAPCEDLELQTYHMRGAVAPFVRYGISPSEVQAWYDETYGSYYQGNPKFVNIRYWINLYKNGDFVLFDDEPQLYDENGDPLKYQTGSAAEYFGIKESARDKMDRIKRNKK